jgi:DNA-binding CsgD family transcriptional regulator
MRHRRMSVEDAYEILRRWHAGQNVSRIAAVEGCDRKTVRKYLQKLMKQD